MKPITPFLWFDTQAEEAAKFYVSVFKNSKITSTTHYTEAGPAPAGTVMTVSFELNGLKYTALNGGNHHKFNPSISFVVNCDSQEEIDEYWDKLMEGGGAPMACGWLTDKYGISWQVIPGDMIRMYSEGTPEQVKRTMEAMMKMIKLDTNILHKAYNGE